jgi:ubiquinone/menaquinone biosynthesis C-methylase UbiE
MSAEKSMGVKETKNFSANAPNYTELVGNAVRFSGLQVDFFTRAKALLLSELATAHFGEQGGLNLLDVGCGIGLLHSLLDERQFVITGTDVAEGALMLANSRNPNATYQYYDGSRLPFDDDTFDMSLTVCVMHHILPTMRDNYLREMQRVTRTGGLICVIEHNPVNPITRLAVMRCTFDSDAILLSSREVQKRFIRVGLKAPRTRFFLLLPFLGKLARRMETNLSWLHLGAQYCVSVVV